jgi:hypothetical protein
MWLFMKSKYLYWASILLIGAIFILGYQNKESFERLYAVCAALFWMIQRTLFGILDKARSEQKKYCKYTGFLLLIPTISSIATGSMIFFRDYQPQSTVYRYLIVGLTGIWASCLLLQLIVNWKNETLAGRFLKQTTIASLSVPLSLIVVSILSVTGADEDALMSLMSAIILGGVALLFIINMMMVSFFDYKSTIDSIRAISKLVKKKKLIFIRVSIIKDMLLVIGKIIISAVSRSFFMFVNALYSGGMGVARFVAVKMYAQDFKKKIYSYRLVGIIISMASICYVLYSVRLFLGGKTGVYSMYVALGIAFYTFVEFGINIREAFRLRKSKAFEAKALRAISFASTLICFVLTQTAIMSFASEGDNSFTNALSGVILGILAAGIGVYVIIDSYSLKKAENRSDFVL